MSIMKFLFLENELFSLIREIKLKTKPFEEELQKRLDDPSYEIPEDWYKNY